MWPIDLPRSVGSGAGSAAKLCRSPLLITLEKFKCSKRYPHLSKKSYFARRTSVGDLFSAIPRCSALVGNELSLSGRLVCFKGLTGLIAGRQTLCYCSQLRNLCR